MRRRTFLKVGAIGGAVLAVAGGAALWLKPAARDAATSEQARVVLRAVIPALLAGALPPHEAAQAREAALGRTLAAIASLPPPTRLELGELFALLASRPGRWLAGVEDWHSADVEQVTRFLQHWRTHAFDLFRAGYHALHDLVLGPWYADESSWPAIGYPGPPTW
ncbi:MAG: hypothetical protein OHK0044_27170 [Burkholderiaceae bacterium]